MITNWGSISFKSTTTTLALTPTTVTHGSNVTAAVAVTGSGTPSGAVGLVASTILPNNKGISALTLGADGTASESINYLPGGTYTVTAQYSGDGISAASSSSPVSITVNPEASSLQFAPVYVDPGTGSATNIKPGSPVPYGSDVLLDVNISGASGTYDGTATGTVTFSDNGSTLATVNVSAGNTAEFNGSLLAVGSHSISATYSGDASYNASSTAPFTLLIAQAPSYVIVFGDSSAVNNADGSLGYVAGQSANLSALVYTGVPGGLYPTGTVTFQLGSGTPVSVPLNPDNDLLYIDASTASAVFANLPLGTQTVTATYNGDANFAPASVAVQPIEVVAATLPLTTTTLSVDPANLTSISPSTLITATATVTGSGGAAPTGYATFTLANFLTFNPIPLTPGTSNTSTAVLTIRAADLLPGSNLLSVVYGGSSTYSPSASSSTVVLDDPSDFTLQSQTTILAVKSGTSASVTLNLASMHGYNGTVALTCAAPAGMVCALNPSTVTLNGNTTAGVTFGTVTHTYSSVRGGGWSHKAAGSLLACLICVVLPFRRRKRLGAALLSVVGLVVLAAGVTACSPSNKTADAPSAPIDLAPGTYSVVITGTGSNGLVHNTAITVIVD